jgi:hypothetical protein
MSNTVSPKKRGRPATGTDPVTTIRFSPDILAALNRSANNEETSRSELIRRIVAEWLRRRGYLPK